MIRPQMSRTANQKPRARVAFVTLPAICSERLIAGQRFRHCDRPGFSRRHDEHGWHEACVRKPAMTALLWIVMVGVYALSIWIWTSECGKQFPKRRRGRFGRTTMSVGTRASLESGLGGFADVQD